jgi:hypothetical protein
MAQLTIRFFLGLLLVVTAPAWACSAASGYGDDYELRTDPRDFYLPGFDKTRVIDFHQVERSDRRGQVIGYLYPPSENGKILSGIIARDVSKRLSSALALCLKSSHGPDGEYLGFKELRPERLTYLSSTRMKSVQRMVLTGATSYEGPEDQSYGDFTCILNGGNVVAWMFKPKA